MSENYFMGLDGFVWFTGVVEDRNDPDSLVVFVYVVLDFIQKIK